MNKPSYEARFSPIILGYIAYRFVEGYTSDPLNIRQPSVILVIIAVALLAQESFYAAIVSEHTETFDDFIFKIIEDGGLATLLETSEIVNSLKARITDGILFVINAQMLSIGRDATLKAIPTKNDKSHKAESFRGKIDRVASTLGKLMSKAQDSHIFASLGVKL